MVNLSLRASCEVKVLDHFKAQPWTTSLSQSTPTSLHTLSYPSRETSQKSRLIPLLRCLLLAIFRIKRPIFDPVCMCVTFWFQLYSSSSFLLQNIRLHLLLYPLCLTHQPWQTSLGYFQNICCFYFLSDTFIFTSLKVSLLLSNFSPTIVSCYPCL